MLDISIEEIFKKLAIRPIREINQNDEMWIAAGYLITSLNSFSDGLIVMDGKTPMGTFGGKAFLKKLVKNPTYSFFKDTKTKEIISASPKVFPITTLLSEIIEYWINTKIAFSIIDHNGVLFALSIRNILFLIAEMNLLQKLSELPKKKIITYNSNDSINDVINKMFENNVRRLQLEGTHQLLSDRTILENICTDMNYLKYSTNFLELKSNVLSTENPDIISKDISVSELAEKLKDTLHPFVIYDDSIVTPWDLLMSAYNGEKK